MSKSFRKPCEADNRRCSHKLKKLASRLLRRRHNQNYGSGNEYKKHYETWNIHDVKWVYHLQYRHSSFSNYGGSEAEYNKLINKLSRK